MPLRCYNFTSAQLGSFSVRTANNRGSKRFDNLSALTPYELAATVPPGWTLGSVVCDNGSSLAAVRIPAGSTVTCVVTLSLGAGSVYMPLVGRNAGPG